MKATLEEGESAAGQAPPNVRRIAILATPSVGDFSDNKKEIWMDLNQTASPVTRHGAGQEGGAKTFNLRRCIIH